MIEKVSGLCAFALFLFAANSTAQACTLNTGPIVSFEMMSATAYRDNTLPSNALFSHVRLDRPHPESLPLEIRENVSADAKPLQVEEISTQNHDSGSQRLIESHWRPSEPLRAGTQIRVVDCPMCEWNTIVGEDHIAPPMPRLSLASVGEPFDDDCVGEIRQTIIIDIALESSPPEKNLNAFIFQAPDAETASETQTLRYAQPLDENNTRLVYTMSSFYNLEAKFCLAIELEDGAGNRSPRSKPLCLDLTPQHTPPSEEPDMAPSMEPTMEPAPMMEPPEASEPVRPMAHDSDIEDPGCSTITSAPGQRPIGALFLALLIGLFGGSRRLRNHNLSDTIR